MMNKYILLILLLTVTLLLPATPVLAQPELIEEVVPVVADGGAVTVSPQKAEDNTALKRELKAKNIDPKDVTLAYDYGVLADNTAVYKHKDTGDYYAIIESAPVVNPDNTVIDCQWIYSNGAYTSPGNTYRATVYPNGLTTVSLPFGNYSGAVKPGASMMFTPQLFLGGQEVTTIRAPYVLPVDPVNANYTNNCLIFDYGFCTRLVRQIEGKLLAKCVDVLQSCQ